MREGGRGGIVTLATSSATVKTEKQVHCRNVMRQGSAFKLYVHIHTSIFAKLWLHSLKRFSIGRMKFGMKNHFNSDISKRAEDNYEYDVMRGLIITEK